MPKTIYLPSKTVRETLMSESKPGTNALDPLKSLALKHQLPLKILEDHQIHNKPEVHLHEVDLWFCLEGEVLFACGGSLLHCQNRKKTDGSIDQNELFGDEIQNGNSYILKPGDWLWIPAGEPHQHGTKTTARLMIIKIPQV